jgi:hypothetical protein
MSREEFWDSTYDEFFARIERWEDQEMRWDLRFGVIASAYVNCKLKEGSDPIPAGRWFGYVDEEEDSEMTPEQTKAFLKIKFTPPETGTTLEPIKHIS